MPEISIFYGIRITMNFSEHNPPHFHASYAEHRAAVRIVDGVVDDGFLPGRQLKIVLAWGEIHRDELMQNWELARDGQPLNRINPLF
ncbi:hypothetical protein FACS1894139_09350 [Planctomycetales bacterium]|nr:hypothetical protein FACS1894107_07250 [Planctomycetales bacterium]GHT05475.1 hypothetical protein FACS1894139_09350 [Planctomycetales bacterium]GHV23526.1 hypothetical protein AGMMS49959_16830 [Planctomycetales bacterium]